MAKKKQQVEDTVESTDFTSALLKEIDEEYGKGIMMSGREVVDTPPQVIPFSPAFDSILGGGIPEGSWVSVAGLEKCGKSISLLDFAANCQMEQYGNRSVMVLASEHRTDGFLMSGIRNLKKDPPHLYRIQSTKGRILDSVDFLNIGLKFLKSVPGGVLIVDSISSLLNPKLLSEGLGAADFGKSNQLVGQFIDLAAPIVKANNCICAGILQFYTNTSGKGHKYIEKAAMKWRYQADIRLECRHFEFEGGNGEDSVPTGQKQTWYCKKSALSGPGGKVDGYIRYGIGIDRTRELIEIGKSFGFISMSGPSWMTLDYLIPELLKGTRFEEKGEVKAQGAEQLYNLLEEHPVWLALLNENVRSVLNPEVPSASQGS